MQRRDFIRLAGGAGLAASNLASPGRLHAATPKADFTLHIGRVSFDLAPGRTIQTIGYSGSVPGPTLRMKQGRHVSVDVFNDTDVPELVHWHGMFASSHDDGSEEEGSPLIPPHGQLRYNFTAEPAGTRWYHTHAMAMADMNRGAYTGQFGFLYVEPESDPGRYDQEIFLAARHWEPSVIHRGAPNNDWNVEYKSCSFNDRALGHGEPIRVRRGQRVLFHILNAEATRALSVVLPGHQFRVIVLDGNPVPVPSSVDVLNLAVAERVDAIVEMNQPGVWVLGSTRDDDRTTGLGIVVEYAGQKGEPKWIAPEKSKLVWDYTIFGANKKVPAPDGKFDLTFKMLPDEGKPFNRWTVNDKFYPDIDPLVVQQGKRYRIAFHNGNEDSHPLHLHRHTFELTNVAGKPTAGIMKDVVNVTRNNTVEVDFVADHPGLSLIHCHMQQHMDGGFKTMLKYA